jgi:cyclopentanol dehydrogenase
MDRLKGKVAIITGAAMGQGAAEAYLFAKEGAKVAAADVAGEKLKETVERINKDFPDAAIAEKLDISSEENWNQVVKDVVAHFGTIDILINNAAIGSGGVIYENVDKAAFDRLMSINAWGPFCGIKAVAPVMKKAGKGSIVNISSLAGVVGVIFDTYTLSKGAVFAMTRGAAQELGKYGIRVNTIVPGTIMTPMTQVLRDSPAVLEACRKKTEIGYLGEPDDIAYGALYLASDEAKYVTGADLTIDGGERYKDVLELDL